MIKDKNGVEVRAGSILVDERDGQIFTVSDVAGERIGGFGSKSGKSALYSGYFGEGSGNYWTVRDGSPPVAPSATPGEVLGKDRDGRDVRRGDSIRALVRGTFVAEKFCQVSRVFYGTYCEGGDYQIPQRAAVLVSPVAEPASAPDTLPSPAPTGSYSVAGATYDEIPSRFGEPDEDAVFKKREARFAKLREEKTAALGRFERLRDIAEAAVATQAATATVYVDKVGEAGNVRGEVRCGGLVRPFGIANTASEEEAFRVVTLTVDHLRDLLGARAMRGTK